MTLNFVWRSITFFGPEYGTQFVPSFRRMGFSGGLKFMQNFKIMCPVVLDYKIRKKADDH